MPRVSPIPPRHLSVDGEEPWSVPSLREPRYSQSLERGLAILGCFRPDRPILGIADLADQLGMSRSTTHRYVITLVALGYLEQGASRKYRLGLRVTELGMSALSSTGLREHAQTHLEDLRQQTGFTVSLGVLDGAEVVYVDRVRGMRRGQFRIDLDLQPGSRLPAYCTALGKVLLAFLPDDDLRQLIGEMSLVKQGPSSIATKRALRAELDQVREDGFAVSDEEIASELLAIAVPVRGAGGEVIAAVNMAAHISMISLDELVSALAPHLLAAADRISARLGFRRSDARDQGMQPLAMRR